MDKELHVNEIASLVDYFEGYGTLAVILNVNVDDLRRWAEGNARPPVDVLLRIVDLRSSLTTAFLIDDQSRQYRGAHTEARADGEDGLPTFR
jgi:hypothetical protein